MKPSGDLRFVLADFPRLGSVCRIHTCSYRSVHQIHSALQEIQTFTGGRLAGITAKLTVRPEEATYFDRKEKRKKTSSIWALSLEVEGDGDSAPLGTVPGLLEGTGLPKHLPVGPPLRLRPTMATAVPDSTSFATSS